MASTSFDKHGRCRLTFAVADGDRRAVRLGSIDRATADAVRTHVEAILTTARYGTPLARSTAAWLGSIDDVLHDRLAVAGLVSPRLRPTLAAFVRAWIDGRSDIGAFTRRNMLASLGYLVRHFGDVAIGDVSKSDAVAFRDALASDGYARATVGKTIKHARQFCAAAVDAGAVTENPFTGVEAWAQENATRKVFVERATVEALLAAEHQPRYRRLIALARYGGLRVPSEIVPLDWADIDWSRDRLTVREAKTRVRVVPLFPELRAILEPGSLESGPVVNGGNPGTNWRRHLEKLIRRAGLEAWPRLFHNLRASRETELVREFPLHVVCEWIGNSEVVAVRHYLTVQESDYQRAAGKVANNVANCVPPLAMIVQPSTKNAPGSARLGESGASRIPPRGVEPGAESSGNQGNPAAGGTEVSWWEQQARRAA